MRAQQGGFAQGYGSQASWIIQPFNGVTGHSPWGHMGAPRHIGTKTMRMKSLGQTVTAVVDICVVRKKQSRQFVECAVACGIYGM